MWQFPQEKRPISDQCGPDRPAFQAILCNSIKVKATLSKRRIFFVFFLWLECIQSFYGSWAFLRFVLEMQKFPNKKIQSEMEVHGAINCFYSWHRWHGWHVYTIETALHCLNSSMHAYMWRQVSAKSRMDWVIPLSARAVKRRYYHFWRQF